MMPWTSSRTRTLAAWSDVSWLQPRHSLFLDLLEDRLHECPFDVDLGRASRVLDLGTGEGDWARAIARRYRNAFVTGIDASARLPDSTSRCRFARADFNYPWRWWAIPFDFIHGRMLSLSINELDRFFAQAFLALQPGGHIEMQELCFEPYANTGLGDDTHARTLKLWSTLLSGAQSDGGLDLNKPQRYREAMVRCGFVDVVEHRRDWPFGSWGESTEQKLLGQLNLASAKHSIEQLGQMFMHDEPGVSDNDILQLKSRVLQAIKNQSIQPRMDAYVIYARRPGIAPPAIGSASGQG